MTPAALLALVGFHLVAGGNAAPCTLSVQVLDSATGEHLAGRVYIRDAAGKFHLPPAVSGRIVTCDVTDTETSIREAYACAGPGGFQMDLPAGQYRVTVERGKEYLPLEQTVEIQPGDHREVVFRLHRLFDMAGRGWFSADCHVHTPLADLPLAQLAEDVNVTFPITAWATRAEQPPAGPPGGDVPDRGRVIAIDGTHVYWNLNTEYEVFKPGPKWYGFGALLVLGHRQPLRETVPPVGGVVREARRQEAILDLEKPSWPWATILAAVGGVDTVELSNNSMWRQRTISHYLWGRKPMPWIGSPPLNGEQFVHYGLESYYAFLNCGFRLAPSAGSANGVHPAPLGTSRVYVKLDRAFDYGQWMEGFRKGRTFVTNGPMLLLTAGGVGPGDRKPLPAAGGTEVNVQAEALTIGDLDRIEIIHNGSVVAIHKVKREHTDTPVRQAKCEARVRINGTSWLAARCFEVSGPDNPRFAHTGPIFFEDTTAGRLRPERRQVQYLIDSVSAQIEAGKNAMPPASLQEYQEALEKYRRLERDSVYENQ